MTKLLVEELLEGAVLRVRLNAPKGNVLDSQMTTELIEVFRSVASKPEVKAVLLTGAGPHFCFGASVEEHRPELVGDMLARFHQLFREILRSGVIVLSAVRGMCLGGGLELVAFCQRVFANPSAQLGQPEIKLGVFAPIASLILADRIGRGAAEDLLLTGRLVESTEALAIGLIDAVEEDPEAAALAWARLHLIPKSAASLRFAARAARLNFAGRYDSCIAELERLYRGELMESHDAREGIEAFLQKRKPNWTDA